MEHTSKSFFSLHCLFVLFLASVIIAVTGCEDGSDGDSDGEVNIGWIAVESTIVVAGDDEVTAALSGKAFVSSDFVAHQCVGIACLLGWYDNSYPGVDVIWWNQTTDEQGTATSRYGTATHWEHLWSANVPLIEGVNELMITADDPIGNSADVNLSVEYTSP